MKRWLTVLTLSACGGANVRPDGGVDGGTDAGPSGSVAGVYRSTSHTRNELSCASEGDPVTLPTYFAVDEVARLTPPAWGFVRCTSATACSTTVDLNYSVPQQALTLTSWLSGFNENGCLISWRVTTLKPDLASAQVRFELREGDLAPTVASSAACDQYLEGKDALQTGSCSRFEVLVGQKVGPPP